jgi:hypothetical protein
MAMMTPDLKEKLCRFTYLVAKAIGRLENGKDADWREILDAQEELERAVAKEPEQIFPEATPGT